MFLVQENELVKSPENWKIIQVIDLGDNESFAEKLSIYSLGGSVEGQLFAPKTLVTKSSLFPKIQDIWSSWGCQMRHDVIDVLSWAAVFNRGLETDEVWRYDLQE